MQNESWMVHDHRAVEGVETDLYRVGGGAPPVQQAQILIPLILAIGAAVLARVLFKPKSQNFVQDNKPTQAMLRGSFVPHVLGTRIVGNIVGMVGDRITTIEEESVSGGKGFGGGGSSVQKIIYHERAAHYLCTGPAAAILGIYADGKLIPGSNNINSYLYPSGSTITFTGYGSCRVYWGEIDQPVDSYVAANLGINTRCPYVCMVVWDRFRIGGTRWPILDYIVYRPGGMVVGPITVPEIGEGTNPGQALWEVLTAPYPHGANLDPSWIDCESLTDIGALAVSEGIGMNIVTKDGDGVDQVVGSIMQDFSLLLAQRGGVLSFFPVRAGQTATVIDNSVISPPFDETENSTLSLFGNSIVYKYDDKDQKYKVGTIDIDDDTDQGLRDARKPREIYFSTVTERNVASKLAARRQVEDLETPLTVKIKAARGLRAVLPGQPLILPEVGQCRVVSSKASLDDPTVEIELLRDPYDQPTIDQTDPSLPGTVPPGPLEADIRFGSFEWPYLLNPGSPRLSVLRHRANQSIISATILGSSDGVSYETLGTQNNPATGGLVAATWDPQTDDIIIEDGPTITIDGNGDEITVPYNLTATPSTWIAGEQIMVIGTELFYVREFVQVSGATWQAKGVIRARAGTAYAPRGHKPTIYNPVEAGAEAYIIPVSKVKILSHPLIATAGVRFSKSIPANAQGSLPPAAVGPDEDPMESLATKTPPLAWAVCGGSRLGGSGSSYPCRRDYTYTLGLVAGANEDLVFEFMPTLKSNGAGMQGAGQPVALPEPTGSFKIEIMYDPTFGAVSFDELTVQNTYTITAAAAKGLDGIYRWTYTRAQMIAVGTDIGYTDSGSFLWQFRISHDDGTLSDPVILRPRYISSDLVPGN